MGVTPFLSDLSIKCKNDCFQLCGYTLFWNISLKMSKSNNLYFKGKNLRSSVVMPSIPGEEFLFKELRATLNSLKLNCSSKNSLSWQAGNEVGSEIAQGGQVFSNSL